MRILAVLLLATLARAADPPAELLARVEAIRQAGRRVAAELWPGWDPTATPLAIHKRNEMAVLVGHPKPPAPFRPYPTSLVSAPVFVADSTQGMTLANTAQPFAGVLTSFIGFNDLMEKASLEEAVALGIHELFHTHQQKIAPNKYGNILVVLWGQYPEFSARNRVLLQLEAESLGRALKVSDSGEVRRHAADFLGLRAERRKEMTAEVARYESGEESHEGLSRYIEYRLLEAAYPARADLREKKFEELAQVGGLARDRERFYVLGMAEGLLLDRLRPGWKREFETSEALLDELLAKAVAPSAPARDLGGLIRQEEQVLAKRADEGSRRLGVLLNQGRKVLVELKDIKKNLRLRGFNPNGVVQLTADHVAHTYLLLDLPGVKLEFTGVPVIYEKLQDALWCALPDEAVQAALEKMTDKLVLKGPGYLMEFEKMEVIQRGRELRIKPAADLERKPAPGKPQILKPEKP